MNLLPRKLVRTTGFVAFCMGLLLIGYIALLAAAHYRAQIALQQASARELTEQTGKLAGTLSYFFTDRAQDLRQLVASHEIRTYFENKALGMSPEYGLQASIDAVKELLVQYVDGKKLGEVPLYELLAFIDADGNVLTAQGSGLDAIPRLRASFLHERDKTFWGVTGPNKAELIVIAEPFDFKSLYLGHCMALLRLDSVCSHFIANQAHRADSIIALLHGRICMYASPDANRFLNWGAMVDIDVLQSGRLQAGRGFSTGDFTGDAYRVFIPVGATPFSLLAFYPLDGQAQTGSALRILFTTAGVFLLFVAGSIVLQRQARRNALLQAQLLQQDKMVSVGQLAAGMAHEINNPTGFVASNLNSLLKYTRNIQKFIDERRRAVQRLTTGACTAEQFCADDANLMGTLKIEHILRDIPELISQSLEGAERIRRIVSDLKNFSNIDQHELKDADINELLESTLNVITGEFRDKCTVEKHFLPLPRVRCNPGQINQVFLNILLNAAQAIQGKGVIAISTEPVRSGYRDHQVKISIRDSGCGIPENIRKRIFEPFFTTREVGKGTGLGLSIVYEIIKKHDGEVSVESTVGQGTCLSIVLPAIHH